MFSTRGEGEEDDFDFFVFGIFVSHFRSKVVFYCSCGIHSLDFLTSKPMKSNGGTP